MVLQVCGGNGQFLDSMGTCCPVGTADANGACCFGDVDDCGAVLCMSAVEPECTNVNAGCA